MSKPKKPRSEAQIRAEQTYAATREIVQVNVKFKAAADVKMWKGLRKRFPDETDSAIARLAIKKLASEGN